MKGPKRRLSINLSFFTLIDPTKQPSSHKTPKNFVEQNGVVGLGILAALNDDQNSVFANSDRAAIVAISSKILSNSIPILRNNLKNFPKKLSVEEMELCEEYTCVISYVGENLVEKREYFEADLLGNSNGFERVYDSSLSCGGEIAGNGIADFLSSCFLCQKMLHGLDIFMYRGESAFCSAECRYIQISIDEKKEKRGRKGTRKQMGYSASPCSGTLQFSVGVAAA